MFNPAFYLFKKGSAFKVCIRTENQDQVSSCPSAPREVSVSPKLALEYLRYCLTGVLSESDSPPSTIPGVSCAQVVQGSFFLSFFFKRLFFKEKILQLRIPHGTMKMEVPTSCDSDPVQPKKKKNKTQTKTNQIKKLPPKCICSSNQRVNPGKAGTTFIHSLACSLGV